jgi:tight adherence protein B
MTDAFLALAVGAGLTLVVIGILVRARDREQSLAEILDLPFGERDVAVEAVTETRGSVAQGTVGFANQLIAQFDAKGSLTESLEKARIPLHAGEYLVVATCATLVVGVLLRIVTGSIVFGAIGLLVGPMLAASYPKFKLRRRRRAFEAQLPDALSLIASSIAAGHTFLRAIQMMCEESEPPMNEEFARVVYETRLGDPVVDALGRMAVRLEIKDLQWVVQAIRIQQTVGGKLADLLHTLADFIRAREEVRREVSVLTAEGRISAYVLGALPVGLMFAMQVLNPGYLQPLLEGKGLFVLAGTGLSIITGVFVILRMVKIEV